MTRQHPHEPQTKLKAREKKCILNFDLKQLSVEETLTWNERLRGWAPFVLRCEWGIVKSNCEDNLSNLEDEQIGNILRG